MNNSQPNKAPTTWVGDMCFGIISSKARSTTLSASADALTLVGPLGKTFHLPSSKVKLVEAGKSSIWFLAGLRTGCIQIHHEIEGIPEPLLFSARDVAAADVAKELEQLGYEVP